MKIGERIREIRKHVGLTQKDLAEKLGVTQAMIGHYERGERNPKHETIMRIADALGVSEFAIYLNTDKASEGMKKDVRSANAIDGIISILADIYGCAEEKINDEFYGEEYCLLVGEGKGAFTLFYRDLQAILDSAKGVISPFVEHIKEGRKING